MKEIPVRALFVWFAGGLALGVYLSVRYLSLPEPDQRTDQRTGPEIIYIDRPVEVTTEPSRRTFKGREQLKREGKEYVR